MNRSIMSHLIAGYPDIETSRQVALGLSRGGAAYLEIQFPFSDPTADGPVIQAACTDALEGGFTLKRGFDLIGEITRTVDTPVYIMTYAAPVVHIGVGEYLGKVQAAGAAGCIIPDLPVGSDEGLYTIAAELGLDAVPVIAPNTSARRLEEILEVGPKHIYSALRAGITGSRTELSEDSLQFLKKVLGRGVSVLGGFGIRSSGQVHTLAQMDVTAVIGSYFVEELNRLVSEGTNVEEGMRAAIAALL